MTDQLGLFGDVGDADAEELTYRTDDGAQVAAPSLFQQEQRPATAAELAATDRHAEFLAEHRALVAEQPEPAAVRAMFAGFGWSVTEG